MMTKLNQYFKAGFFFFLFIYGFGVFNPSVASSNKIDETSKKWSESSFSKAEIISSKESYRNLVEMSTRLTKDIDTLYGNNVKSWYTIRSLQKENIRLKKQLNTMQETLRKINNSLFQMQQRLEIQKTNQ